MIISPYRTQLTRMIQDGHSKPERDMTNRKSLKGSSSTRVKEQRK